MGVVWVLMSASTMNLVGTSFALYIGAGKRRCLVEADIPWWLILLIVVGVAVLVYLIGLV